MTDRQILGEIKKLQLKSKKSNINKERELEVYNNRRRWLTYYRENIEIYIEKRMGFHGFGYQNFSYHIMDKSDQYIEVSTRGVGK